MSARILHVEGDAGIAQLIQERTVKFHVDRVLRKLQAATRLQATVACVRFGPIEP